MPLLLVVFGTLLIVAAVRNTLGSLATHFSEDIQAKQGGVSFLAWFLAIVLIGMVGYIPNLQTVSRSLLALVILVVLLKNGGGVLSQFVRQISHPPAPTPAQSSVPANLPAIPISSDGSGGSSAVSAASNAAATAAAVAQ